MFTRQIFLGRQPILDRGQRVIGYELLFRDGETEEAQVVNDVGATASVFQFAFGELGVGAVLGSGLGFVNLPTEVLLSDVVECLPADQVVLELLETVVVDDEVVARCAELKELGYRLALDDFSYDPRYDELLDLVDVVKIDVAMYPGAALDAVVALLRRWPVQLLAEKVDSPELAERCHALGFELFQGYYFARPTVLTRRHVESTPAALARLLALVVRDADNTLIEAEFKRHPELTLKLLRLVNSVACGVGRPLTSVGEALYLLGRRQLLRWLQLLLYALDDRAAYPSPLLLLAATRGGIMERLAERQDRDERECDEAFMVGILSLLDTLIGQPLAELVEELKLGPRLASALLERGGELGLLLKLAESVEHADLPGARALLGAAGLSLSDLTGAEAEAMRWANQIAEPTNE